MNIKVGKTVSADADVPVVTPWTQLTCVCLLLLYYCRIGYSQIIKP